MEKITHLKTDDSVSRNPGKNHYVVAIGASAGGLEAIHEFFDNMSDSANLSFVIIQHLSSDYKSLLVELVSRHTNMKVYEAGNNIVIQKNCIYVIPNNKLIKIDNNKLLLEDKKNVQAPNNAIDTFLYSLARDKKQRAIAVILSGTGTDGTRGIEAIKNAGGLVIVQDPESAKFDGMPNSAIQLGITDIIVPPRRMPEEILNYIRVPLLLQQNFSEQDLEEIFQLIHSAAGYDFHYYKLPTLIRRIVRRMVLLNLKTLEEYKLLLRSDIEECRQLANDFLIGVTRFFRDKEAFEELNDKVILPLVASKSKQETIKVWVCACSTGEEAYSLAILLNEAVSKSEKEIDIKIFATDIDEVSIDIAAKGVYPTIIEKDIRRDFLEKYFVNNGNAYQIVQKIRKQIVFARHDVIRDPPFINNDIVSCRNMLIYISPYLQQKIFSVLMFSVSRNGYLFLGSSEHSSFIRDHVEEINAKWKIYRKVRESKIAGQYMSQLGDRSANHNERRPFAKPDAQKPKPIWEALKQAIAEELDMVAFFIDSAFTIRESTGNYEKFLSLPKKSLQLNLLNMIPPELYFVLSTEIKKAWKEGIPVTLRNVKFRKKEKLVHWQVFIKPLQPYTLVVITEQDVVELATAEHVLPDENGRGKDTYIMTLESELQEVRTNLDLAVEDLETTNEELQSSNEELLSANEELQSSNEELQSLNEELHTLNTEHQLKIRELVELNDDLNNYFRSTDIAQVFLDKDLNIRKYNPASARMINFIDSDIGRPLAHISNNILYKNFHADVQKVLTQRDTIEREVSMLNGKNLLMRIMPYVNRDREINGIIITFVDITTITQLNNTIRAVLNASHGAILAFNAERTGNTITDFTLNIANNAAEEFLKKPASDAAGMSLKQDLPYLAIPALYDQFVRVTERDEVIQKDIFLEQQQKWYSLIAVKMMDGFVATFSDITSKKRSEQKLRKNYHELITVKDNLKVANERLESKVAERTRELTESEERFRLVASATNDALYDWHFVNDHIWLSDAFFKLFGYTPGPEFDKRNTLFDKLHPEERKEVTDNLFYVINNGINQWNRSYRFRKANGEYAFVLDRGYILKDEFGTPYRMLGSIFDVTELKIAEHKLATMNEQLEHKVMERTQELEQINTALEISNSDLQQFASIASHDLQEPLRKIQMFAQLIRDEYTGESENPIHRYINKILISSERMRALIADVLNYSRLSANDSTFQPIDLNELVKGVTDDFELTIAEKNAMIYVEALPKIDAIPGLIRQVFQNLISNSLKFTRQGVPPVISITSKRLAKRSFMSMPQEDGPYVLITITDNGIGFDPQFSSNIFNIFQRLHSKDRYEGTGIGLAITKKIIEKHNGIIRGDSKEGEGASFKFILPFKPN